MFRTGMVSVTFRQLSAARVIELSAQAGLDGIEWGGDIHVPHGELELAADVRLMTDEAMLDVISYGSYYRLSRYSSDLADIETDEEIFAEVSLSANGLGAPNIRLWAGNKGNVQTSLSEREHWILDAQIIADSLEDDGIDISFEFHSNTLTDTPQSALDFIQRIDRKNAKLYWQPNQHLSVEENLAGLDLILPYLSHVHVFAWEGTEKFPLAHHADRWLRYLEKIKNYNENIEHALLLEFVKNDNEEQFLRDAEQLHHLLHQLT